MKKMIGLIALLGFLSSVTISAYACPKGWIQGPNATCKKP